MKIVFLDADTIGEDVSLETLKPLGNFVSYPHTLREEVVERCADATIVIANKTVLDAELLAQLPQLKLICIAATGTNNVDLEYTKAHNILVKNAVNYSTQSVAQHTFALLLSLIGNIHWHDQYVKGGAYAKNLHFTHLDKPYFEIAGKTWGIIGLGNIGHRVAEIATAFGAKIVYASVSGSARQEIYPALSLEELLRTSDIVSIHSPLNEKTKNLINAERIALLKNNAILVNVGRGGIVDEQALATALDHDHILGACVDVFEKEPIAANNPLLKIKNSHKLLLTPHTAWASKEARERLVEIILGHINEFKKN